MARILYSDPYLLVTLDDHAGIVRYIRTREPFPEIETVRLLHERLRAVFEALPPGKFGLIIDPREAPPRNDGPFEEQSKRSLGVAMARFKRSAVLVKSAVGRLQAQRMVKERSLDAHPKGPATSEKTSWNADEMAVFTDEAEAIAYLQTHRHH
jgi:hypothetical protein